MLGGWLAFAAATAVFSALALPLLVALGLVMLTIALGLAVLPRPVGDDTREHVAPPAWDLPLRAACAAALVLSLTALSGWLGPQLSGLLAPFPIMATVLATFTDAQRGTDELRRLMYGLIVGFGVFVLFCFALAVALRRLDTAAAFPLATALALCTQSLVTAKPHSSLADTDASPSQAWLEPACPEPERETA